MSHILWEYQRPEPATWVYLSSLLTLALYFVFHRFWSIRNLDLALLVLLAPGMLLVQKGQQLQQQSVTVAASAAENDNAAAELEVLGLNRQRFGFIWLFAVGGVVLVRLLLDPVMVRRPLLDPNLSAGALTFLGCALLVFLLANVINGTPVRNVALGLPSQGPGYWFFKALPDILADDTRAATASGGVVIASRIVAIIGNLALVIGLLMIGQRHFNNIKAGLGAAVLYLLSPYSAWMMGYVDHVLPGALLVWAVFFYRRPAIAGVLLGTAAGLVYYPLFLLPLWLSFYWQRGFRRFGIGVLLSLSVMLGCLAIGDTSQFLPRIQQMFGILLPMREGLQGVWGLGWNPNYRIPIITGFMILACSLAFWPAQKNLGTLLCCSAGVMVAAQFWHAFGGGLYMAWYLPLLLLTVFRPNLEDRIALKVIGGRWRNQQDRLTRTDSEAA